MRLCVYNWYSRPVRLVQLFCHLDCQDPRLLMMLLWYSLMYLLCCYVNLSLSSFGVYWNVPTETCHKYGYNFSDLRKYGLIQNEDDAFKGEKITILYDPGMFPAILGSEDRNGGVPQEGNLTRHLVRFQKELVSSIPETFSGIGILDFERWRPIWRENWGSLDLYRKRSIKIEKEKHPFWPTSRIEQTAEGRFEKAAYRFMDETLLLARRLRPGGVWGYYAFPYCFNYTPKNPKQACTEKVIKDNDRSTWMYETGTALFPSIYMREKELNEEKRVKMIAGRMEEAVRVTNKQRKWKMKILPYLAVKYQDTFKFLTKVDMANGIRKSKKFGGQGVILWGASKDTNTAKKCEQLLNYVTKVIKPIIKLL